MRSTPITRAWPWPAAGADVGHRHEIVVRYGEVDMQQVVFNAHYLAYLDDAVDHWMRELDARFEDLGWDFMVKHADLEWLGGAGLGDTITIDSVVSRWGNTSFVVRQDVHVGERPVMAAAITYVGVEHGTTDPMPAPAAVRAHLGPAVERPE
jgi:acyl-CoA thioester hydrolase